MRRERAVGERGWVWMLAAALATLLLELGTLQWAINGGSSPYTTDVGEIQNALPRWGTLHYSGYPLYSLLGSATVALMRAVGMAPAAGSSLVSALWGAVAMACFAALALELGAGGPWALGGALLGAVTLSFWVDGSLAEVHTMTMALSLAALLWALRFRRTGRRRDLLLLTLAATQGVVHQRAVAFLAPALVVLVAPRWREVWANLLPALGVAVLAPLSYLYLPLRAWQGATWTFGAPGTWRGFWALVLDNKATRIVSATVTGAELLRRGKLALGLLGADLPLVWTALGLGGLAWALRRRRWVAAGMTLAWLPCLPLMLVIWEARISDALLAVKLLVPLMAALGLALVGAEAAARGAVTRWATGAALATLIAGLGWLHAPQVLAVTRDRQIERVVALVEGTTPPADRPTTLLAPWGNEYWALVYAQAYRAQLAVWHIVDHNSDLSAILARGDHLVTPSETFYAYPLEWWQGRLGQRVSLSSLVPGLVEVSTRPLTETAALPRGAELDLENGLRVWGARLEPTADGGRLLTVYWQAVEKVTEDYAVAVHVLAQDPPRGPQDILAQADRAHPVEGWNPTTRFLPGEVVCDHYPLPLPAGGAPAAVRVGMYRQLADGSFENSPWLVLPWGSP